MERAKARTRRCAIYTRKSSEEGLEQDFNSLHAQREACEAFIKSQAGEGWRLIKTTYDDGGLSGGTMERPALQRLLADINQGMIDVEVVYKVDRLTFGPRKNKPWESPSPLASITSAPSWPSTSARIDPVAHQARMEPPHLPTETLAASCAQTGNSWPSPVPRNLQMTPQSRAISAS